MIQTHKMTRLIVAIFIGICSASQLQIQSNNTFIDVATYWHYKTPPLSFQNETFTLVPLRNGTTFLPTCSLLPPDPNYSRKMVLTIGENGWFGSTFFLFLPF